MRSSTSDAVRVRKQIRSLQHKIVAAQRDIARCKKKARSAETHSKFLLGSLIRIAGWKTDSLEIVEHRLQRIGDSLQNEKDVSHFRDLGDALFDQHRQLKNKYANERVGAVAPYHKTGDDWKAEMHFRITVGGMVVKYNLAMESKAVLLGAMASMTSLVRDDGS